MKTSNNVLGGLIRLIKYVFMRKLACLGVFIKVSLNLS